jgi:hypothetical protein
MRLSKAIASSPESVKPRDGYGIDVFAEDESVIGRLIWSGGLYTY